MIRNRKLKKHIELNYFPKTKCSINKSALEDFNDVINLNITNVDKKKCFKRAKVMVKNHKRMRKSIISFYIEKFSEIEKDL